MPEFKQLGEAQKPADAERCIVIDVIFEPAIGKQYSVTGKGIEPNDRMRNESTYQTLQEAREQAWEWAETLDVPVIYLRSDVALMES
jgi:hypothetical protein